jgi:transposase
MTGISLTSGQKKALELRHRKARDARECDRIKAVLLRSEGWSISSIAQALRITVGTVTCHLNDYLESEKMTPKNGGSQCRMTDEQAQKLEEHLIENTYAQVNQIIKWISEQFNIKYTVSGLTKWLQRAGFSYKSFKGIPHKVDLEKQEEFVEKYQSLKATLPESEVLLFMDAVHPTQATKLGSGWIKKGRNKTIETTGSRSRLNIVGAIELDNIAEGIFRQFDRINGESVVEFFGAIRKAHASRDVVHLVLDGAGYHTSKEVKQAAKDQGIELHYLPPYSPNLNPIERLWKVMNEYARNNKYFATAKEFRSKIQLFFEKTLPEIGHSLNSRINDHFETLNPAS